MRNCFIPGCDKFCRIAGTVKRKMFVVPKDKELFDAWADVLPKQKALKAHDKICERHFDAKEISTTYDNIVNGQLYKMERGRAKLNPKAIPSRNLDCDEKLHKARLKNTVLSTKPRIQLIEEITPVETEISQTIEEQELEVDGEVQDITEICLKEVLTNGETIVPYEEIPEDVEIEMCDTQVQELFESLYDDIYEVVLPNTLWGVHRCPEHSSIFFSFVDPSMLRTTKLVSISSIGEIKVLLGSRLISEQNLVVDISSIESLTSMIAEIDEVILCSRAFDNEFCEVSIKNTNSEVCETCSQVERL